MRNRTITLLVKKYEEKIYNAVAAMHAQSGAEWFHLDEVAQFLRDQHTRYTLSSDPTASTEFALVPLDLYPTGWTDDILAQGLKDLTSRAMLKHRRTERGNEVGYLAPDEHQLSSVRSPEYTQHIVDKYGAKQQLALEGQNESA